MAKKGRRQK